MTHRRAPLLLLFSLMAVGCAAADTILPEGTDANGLKYDVSLVPRSSAAEAVTVRLRIVNTSAASQEISYSDCPSFSTVSLRVYSPAGQKLWDAQTMFRGLACTLQKTARIVGPGQSTEFYGAFNATQILGDSLPPGRYEMRIPLRYAQPRFPEELVAGSADLAKP